MYVYSVIEIGNCGSNKELKTFSSLVKALTFIEQTGGVISSLETNGNWDYKEYCSEAEWAKILLDKKDLDNRYYFSKKLPYLVSGYKINRKKVY